MTASEERRTVIIRYAVYSIGIFLNFSGYLVLLSLQSSINIEDGVGASTVTATYATSAAFGVIVTPILLRKLGPKICLLLCEFAYMVYILANAYPVSYTLIPAGVITGMGEATMWPVMGLFVVHYARCYAKHAKKSADSYITQFIGIFYAVFQMSAVFGYLLGYAILYGGETIETSNTAADNLTVTISPIVRDLSICGINDCQDPNITAANGDRYEPASITLIYILVGVTAGMVLLAMLLHFFFTKPVDSSLEIEDEIQQKSQEKNHEPIFKFMFSTIKATFLHIINPRQILLTPFALYSGLLLSFGFNELTRAFGSCMIGVEQVGLMSALLGGADAISCYCSCKFASWKGRDIPLIFGYFMDIGMYMICIFWIPTESSLWVVYIIFVMVGISDGIWQPLVNEIHAAYFPENRDIALTVWSMYTLVGIAWQTAWSTTVCVYLKVYIQIGILTFAFICYGISRKVYGGTNEIEKDSKAKELTTKL